MKATLPKDFGVLADELASITADISAVENDLMRARAAVAEAERQEQELQTMTRQRAEVKAQAFVSHQVADMTELDQQLETLEESSRQIREDGAAAGLAITLLEGKRDDLVATRSATMEKRKDVAMNWLASLERAAIQRHIKSVIGLKDDIVEASACGGVLHMLCGSPSNMSTGYVLLTNAQSCDFAIPKGLWPRFYNEPWRPPVPWLQAHFDTGRRQDQDRVDELLALLRDAGILER